MSVTSTEWTGNVHENYEYIIKYGKCNHINYEHCKS